MLCRPIVGMFSCSIFTFTLAYVDLLFVRPQEKLEPSVSDLAQPFHACVGLMFHLCFRGTLTDVELVHFAQLIWKLYKVATSSGQELTCGICVPSFVTVLLLSHVQTEQLGGHAENMQLQQLASPAKAAAVNFFLFAKTFSQFAQEWVRYIKYKAADVLSLA